VSPVTSRSVSAFWRPGVIASIVGLMAAGCGAQSQESSAAATPLGTETDEAHIAAVHRAKCGTCHVRVDPGTRSRTEIELALGRHHRRTHLTDREWTLLVDYLAKDREALSASAPRLAAQGVTR
jgi:hypothetical protein